MTGRTAPAKSRRGRILRIVITLAALGGAAYALRRMSWKQIGAAFAHADLLLLLAATIVNVFSLAAKGEAWHLLLRPLAPHGGWAAQVANLIGSAVNSISVSVAGDAVRVHEIVRREKVPLRPAVQSVVATRVLEGVTLAGFIMLGPALMRLPHFLRGVQIGAIALIVIFLALTLIRRNRPLPRRVPGFVREIVEFRNAIGSWGRMALPLLFASVNWAIQWLTYDWALTAVGARPGAAGAYLAMIAANVIGFFRFTPANVGVFQAAVTGALAGLGISPEKAFTGSLVLQAIQVLPILAAGMLALSLGGGKAGLPPDDRAVQSRS